MCRVVAVKLPNVYGSPARLIAATAIYFLKTAITFWKWCGVSSASSVRLIGFVALPDGGGSGSTVSGVKSGIAL